MCYPRKYMKTTEIVDVVGKRSILIVSNMTEVQATRRDLRRVASTNAITPINVVVSPESLFAFQMMSRFAAEVTFVMKSLYVYSTVVRNLLSGFES